MQISVFNTFQSARAYNLLVQDFVEKVVLNYKIFICIGKHD